MSFNDRASGSPRMTSHLHPSVSIIIPVFNDEARLETCLERLEGQTYPRDRYEIIVADNDSAGNVREIASRFTRTRIICETKPGSYAARNAGISMATGEILGFTDSDCLPRNNWIEEAVATLMRDKSLGLVGGQMILFPRDSAQRSPSERYQEICGFPQEDNVLENHYAVTANLFTLRKVLDDVGHFNDELKSGGDREWGGRVFAAGYRQAYAKDAVVEHPSRYSLGQLARKRLRTTGGRIQTRWIDRQPHISLASDFNRIQKRGRARYQAALGHPLMRSRWNRIVFMSIVILMQAIEFAEIIRLHLGGSPKRQ